MPRFPKMALMLSTGILMLAASSPAVLAATTVQVRLWDKGEHAMDMLSRARPMNMARMHSMMMSGGMMMGPMGITASVTEVPAGEVTFSVTNASTGLLHEMVISPVPGGTTELPYLQEEMQVDEDAAGNLGEVEELDVGKSGRLTVTLTPGVYLLYCNIPGHYALGMWTLITVAP